MARTWKFYFKDKKELEKFIQEGPREDLPEEVIKTLKTIYKKTSLKVLDNKIHQLTVDNNTGKYLQLTNTATSKSGTYEVE